MKNKRIQKLLTQTTALLACALLIGNTIPAPTPTDEDGNPIIIELPSSGDEGDGSENTPLNDEDPFNNNNE